MKDTLKIHLKQDEKLGRMITVENREVLDGMKNVDGLITSHSFYPTINEENPYLHVMQAFNPRNPHVKWSFDVNDHVMRSGLIKGMDVLAIVSVLDILDSKYAWDFVFTCNCDRKEKEHVGRACYYMIPLVQGIPDDPDYTAYRTNHPDGDYHVITVHKAVGIPNAFCVRTILIDVNGKIGEYCRMDVKNLDDTLDVVEGLRDKKYVGEKMYFDPSNMDA